MNRSDLSKLVREAATINCIENLDPESENYSAQVERAVMCLPADAKLGDANLSWLSFRMEASAFDGMNEEEIREFLVEQFPEHKWGIVACWKENGLLSVQMNEARAQVSTLIRANARIVVYGNIKKKNFVLGVELDANDVLPFMDESEFVQLVISQFPQHNWYATHCYQKDGSIAVLLYSAATKGKSPHELGAKSVSLIEGIYMLAKHLYLDGSDSIEPVPMFMKDYSSSIESLGITVIMHADIIKLFGEGKVLRFIAEQIPEYTILPQTKHIDNKAFQVTLTTNE